MKFIGIMSLMEDRENVAALIKEHGVQVFSEADIVGHATGTSGNFGWFTTPQETPEYSSLCFAVLSKDNADALFDAITARQATDPGSHPIRAFIMPVERMI